MESKENINETTRKSLKKEVALEKLIDTKETRDEADIEI
jgi:hypothetical protein